MLTIALLAMLAALGFVACGGGGGAWPDSGGGTTPPVEPPVEPPVTPPPASRALGADIPDMRSPVRIDRAPDGRIIVSDFSTRAVYYLDPETLQRVGAFRVPEKPGGIAISADTVYVANGYTGNVQAFSYSTGALLYNLGEGVQNLVPRPADMALDDSAGEEKLFVVSQGMKRVEVFALDGAYIGEFPAAGAPSAELLLNPTGIALDKSNKKVYVSDFGSATSFSGAVARVQVYSYTGVYLGTISGKSTSLATEYRFSCPQGMALMSNGNLIIVDSLLGNALVLDISTLSMPTGVKSVGTIGMGADELMLPLDVLLDDASGDLHITNNQQGRVSLLAGGAL